MGSNNEAERCGCHLKGMPFREGWGCWAALQTWRHRGSGLCLGWGMWKHKPHEQVQRGETLALCSAPARLRSAALLVKWLIPLLCCELSRECDRGDVLRMLPASWLWWMMRGSDGPSHPPMLTVFLTPGLELPGETGKEQQVQLEVLVLWPEVRPEHLFCFVCLLVLVSRWF